MINDRPLDYPDGWLTIDSSPDVTPITGIQKRTRGRALNGKKGHSIVGTCSYEIQ
jgi:hypothetical protein